MDLLWNWLTGQLSNFPTSPLNPITNHPCLPSQFIYPFKIFSSSVILALKYSSCSLEINCSSYASIKWFKLSLNEPRAIMQNRILYGNVLLPCPSATWELIDLELRINWSDKRYFSSWGNELTSFEISFLYSLAFFQTIRSSKLLYDIFFCLKI